MRVLRIPTRKVTGTAAKAANTNGVTASEAPVDTSSSSTASTTRPRSTAPPARKTGSRARRSTGVARRQRRTRSPTPSSDRTMAAAAAPDCSASASVGRSETSRAFSGQFSHPGSGVESNMTIAVAKATSVTPTTTGNARSSGESNRPAGWVRRSAAKGTNANPPTRIPMPKSHGLLESVSDPMNHTYPTAAR